MKLYEFSALIRCSLVVAAESESDAREEIKTFERAWFETGDFVEVAEVDLNDVRDPESPDLEDEAHVIAPKK